MLESDRRVMADRDRENPPALRMVPDGRYADWEAIYRDNATWVYRTIFARVGNQPDAEDLTAEVFLAALRPLRISATIPEVRAYLRATARTTLAANYRRILELRFLQGCSIKDSATEMGVSVANAKVLQHRALQLAAQVNGN